jgi:hypothetical protein
VGFVAAVAVADDPPTKRTAATTRRGKLRTRNCRALVMPHCRSHRADPPRRWAHINRVDQVVVAAYYDLGDPRKRQRIESRAVDYKRGQSRQLSPTVPVGVPPAVGMVTVASPKLKFCTGSKPAARRNPSSVESSTSDHPGNCGACLNSSSVSSTPPGEPGPVGTALSAVGRAGSGGSIEGRTATEGIEFII